ncbi:unnamed protein product [Rhizoctonia solani]|uniref:Uncharacterized protein n=1 Tax=Rhizoctonia solani TaxID=456999 RepID=A0A8H3CE03_9AGAM
MTEKFVLDYVVSRVTSWKMWDVSRWRIHISSFIEFMAVMIDEPICPPSVIYNFLYYMYKRDPSLFTGNIPIMTLYRGAPVEFRTGFYPMPVFFWIRDAGHSRVEPPTEPLVQESDAVREQVLNLQETVKALRGELDAAKGELSKTTRELNMYKDAFANYVRSIPGSSSHISAEARIKTEHVHDEEGLDDNRRGVKRPRCE